MKSLLSGILAILLIALFIGCQKSITEPPVEEISAGKSQSTNSSNPRLSYGDTVFYLKNQPGNYTILPVSIPNNPGYFKAIPLGLVLDSVTGKINVTQSETGLRYKVYYLSPTSTLLDSVKIVISGVDYRDSIYEIVSTTSTYDTAFPIYNARPGLPLPCPDDDDDVPEEQTCVFDETDLDGDGNDDIPGVIQDKLLIDIKKGTIDVEASYHAGVFGSVPPANGVTKDFTFYYRLADASNRALNKLTVRLYHFRHRSDIPQALLDTLNDRNNLTNTVNSFTTRGAASSLTNQGNTANRSFSLGFAELLFAPKRPPIIIIISQ